MRRYALFLFIPLFFGLADEQEIADAIRYVSNKSRIDARIYYSIIDVESGFRPYAISMLTNKAVAEAAKKLPKPTYEVKSSKYEGAYLVSVFAKSEDDIVKLAKILYGFDFNIDMGLMQISKQNISTDELDFIFNPKYNIIKGNNVLANCAKAYKTLPQSIECYNKGFKNKNSFEYYKKFAKSFNNNFGDDR